MVQDDDEELVVSLPVMEDASRSSTDKMKDFFGTIRVIWYELTAGVGAWGSLKPLLAAGFAAIPFLFFGQHFNRQHQKGFDWTLLQIPLLLTIVLWPILWVWSIVDAYRVAMLDVTENENQKRVMAALD